MWLLPLHYDWNGDYLTADNFLQWKLPCFVCVCVCVCVAKCFVSRHWTSNFKAFRGTILAQSLYFSFYRSALSLSFSLSPLSLSLSPLSLSLSFSLSLPPLALSLSLLHQFLSLFSQQRKQMQERLNWCMGMLMHIKKVGCAWLYVGVCGFFFICMLTAS